LTARPKLFASHPLFDAPRKLLAEHFDVEYWPEPTSPPRPELLSRVAGKDALLCVLNNKIDAELLAAGPQLRMVANLAVGFDNIDLDACTRRGVAASNTPGVLDETVADFAWTIMLAAARRLIEGDTMARSGGWIGLGFSQFCGADVWGKTLGVIGFGRIGRAVARRARGFGMRIIYYNHSRAPVEAERELNAELLECDQVLAQSDFVSLHVPLNQNTRGMIGARELALMKPTAFLVNTARGPIVDEAALIAALAAGTIAGAALDVYEHEPQIPDGLRRPNVVLAPHLGSASIETRTKMAMLAAENAVAFFAGQRPPNILNPQVLPPELIATDGSRAAATQQKDPKGKAAS
jgi:glyoxylate reductase